MNNEVVIIGGGIIGLSCAYYLSKAGIGVTLVERDRLGQAATHGNACWIATSHVIPTSAPGVLGQGLKWMLDRSSPFYIKPRADVDLMRWLLKFRAAATDDNVQQGAPILKSQLQESLALYKELDAQGLEFDFAQQGLVQIQFAEKYVAAAKREKQMMDDFGVDCHLLDRDDLRELIPNLQPEVEHGLFRPEPAQVNPDKLTAALAEQCGLQGVTILEDTEVKDFKTEKGRINAIETTNGMVSGAQFVMAAGAWTSLVAKQLGDWLPMQPAKGYSITAKRPAPTAGPNRAIAVDDYKLAITPLGTDFRFSSTLELAGFDPSINPHRIEKNWQGLRRTLRDMEQVEVKETWSGYRPLSADGLPIVERSERVPNVIYATGHGMLGLSLGPVTGVQVTGILTSQAE